MIVLDTPIARIGRFNIFPAPDGGATLMGAGFIKTYRRIDSARRHARKLAADDERLEAALRQGERARRRKRNPRRRQQRMAA